MTDFAPVRFGILGAARIARSFSLGLAGSDTATVAAVASRGAEKAHAFVAEFGVPCAYSSYEALLADPTIEAVYIPLPNHLHAEWAIRAAEAGKHVLCEKPLAMNAEEARAMFAAAKARGIILAEAYPYMSQPQTLRVRELLGEGAIGRVLTVVARFSFPLCDADGLPFGDPGDIRLDPTRGGGALLDAGSYAMSMIRIAAGERPVRAHGTMLQAPSGVDRTSLATLEFPGGLLAQMSCSLASGFSRFARLIGEDGEIETNYLNHQPPNEAMLLRVKRSGARDAVFETIETPGGDGFRLEAESFARAVRLGPEHWNGASEAESIDTILSLTAIATSAREGRWMELEPVA